MVQTASAETPFDVIPAGAPDAGAAELLSGPSFVSLVSYLRRSYDFVIVDSPPFPLVVDALVVASYADFVLSVLRVGNSARDAAQAHLQRFVAMGVRHAVIVNGVRAPTAYGQYGYGATYAVTPADCAGSARPGRRSRLSASTRSRPSTPSSSRRCWRSSTPARLGSM